VDNECRKVWGDLGIGFTSGRWLFLCRVAAYLNHLLSQRRQKAAAREASVMLKYSCIYNYNVLSKALCLKNAFILIAILWREL
jgi:hypothetical protein